MFGILGEAGSDSMGQRRCSGPHQDQRPGAAVLRADDAMFSGAVAQDATSKLMVVGQVRLDDRAHLSSRLGVAASEAPRTTDLDRILLAWRKWGPECLRYLAGDYAFAVYDATQQCLFCARDHIGACPFYYCSVPPQGLFAFADDLRELLNRSGADGELDETSVAAYLQTPGFCHPTRTFFHNVHKLPPGHAMTINRRGLVTINRYWAPEDVPENRLASRSEYAEGLLHHIQTAVSDRLQGDVSVGAHISGGLDCSSIAVLAAQQLQQSDRNLQAYSWSEPPADERQELRAHTLIQDITEVQRFPVHYLPPDFELWLGDISQEPYFDLGAERTVAQMAAGHGVQLMLSGWGGDEVASFNGRGLYCDLFRSGDWIRLASELHARGRSAQETLLRTSYRLARLTASRVIRPLLPVPSAWGRPRQYGSPDCLNADFAARMRANQPIARTWPQWTSVRGTMNALVNHGHIAMRMEHWAAHGKDHGLTYVYPLTDRRVLEFCLGAPATQFVRNGVTRALFREAMQTVLPDSSRHSSKQEQTVSSDRHRNRQTLQKQLHTFLQQIQSESGWGQCLDIPRAIAKLQACDVTRGRADRQQHMQILRALQIEIVYRTATQSTSQGMRAA